MTDPPQWPILDCRVGLRPPRNDAEKTPSWRLERPPYPVIGSAAKQSRQPNYPTDTDLPRWPNPGLPFDSAHDKPRRLAPPRNDRTQWPLNQTKKFRHGEHCEAIHPREPPAQRPPQPHVRPRRHTPRDYGFASASDPRTCPGAFSSPASPAAARPGWHRHDRPPHPPGRRGPT